MKITKLRFKNLNSLAGEWSIDFTSPEYIADGIFAISGPTGAGKSTILDAICLALYGCTPRLKNISNSTNEIMSRQTGECFAEVVFETNEGSFRAHWSQRRAHRKAAGELQQPKHEISDASTGNIFASQLRKTSEVIEEKTGMDFGRFTQSMMLAQGGFAAFLSAAGNDRAPILEQITGTEIYSQISMHVFKQNRTEKEKLALLEAENSGIMIMSPEEEEKAKKELGEMNKSKEDLDANINKLDTAIKWLERIEMISGEIAAVSLKVEETEKKNLEFAPLRERLANAVKAANSEGEYASLNILREQQNTETYSLQSLKEGFPVLEAAREEAAKALSVAEKQHSEAKSSADSLMKTIKEVRRTDSEIARKEEADGKISSELARLRSESKAEAEKMKEAEGAITKLKAELAEIDNYQKIHAPDAFLIAGFTGIESTLERVQESLQSVKDTEEKLDSLKAQLKDKSNEHTKALEKFRSAEQKHSEEIGKTEKIKSEISVLLGERTAEELMKRKDALILRIAELKQVADYETAREKLEDGKPCPLCGSVHHPYAEGNTPAITEEESELRKIHGIIEKHATLIKEANKLSADERESAEKVAREKTGLEILKNQVEELQKKIAGLDVDLAKAKAGFEKTGKGLKTTILPLGITELPEAAEDIENLKDLLKSRRDTWKTNEERKVGKAGSVQSKQSEIAVSEAVMKSKEDEAVEKAKEYEVLKDSLNELRSRRKEQFGEKNPDNEEILAARKISDAEAAMKAASEILMQKKQLLADSSTRISGLEEGIAAREKAISKALKEFSESMKKNGFKTEEEFVKARMTAEERSELEERSRELEKEKTELILSKKTRSTELEKETSKNLTAEKAEKLLEQMEKAKEEAIALFQAIVIKSGLINSNEDAKQRGQDIALKISSQASICKRWSDLNNLIGSADGKKYRNFAQSLTLELMVSYANSQLAKLSDRYLLIRNSKEPLELDVVDNYQAGEIRSTKNLSGGESFIVSLALALGLSGMASRKVRVDSLFLDEGFGTLDEETLETALGTLASLRQDGKIIGVISHVGAMKERINTRITVQPVREGRSVISGPGCREGSGM